MNKIKFYRDGKQYYFTYQNETKEVSDITLNKLQTSLRLPFEMVFVNMSLAQREKLISRFLTNGVNYQYGFTESDEPKVTFTKQRHKIHAYCMPSKVNMEGRSENCRPYILTTLGEDKILMEVSNDYVLNHDDPYYYLYSDMTENERNFFSPVYRLIECDYVYQLAYQTDKPHSLGRRKR